VYHGNRDRRLIPSRKSTGEKRKLTNYRAQSLSGTAIRSQEYADSDLRIGKDLKLPRDAVIGGGEKIESGSEDQPARMKPTGPRPEAGREVLGGREWRNYQVVSKIPA